MIGILGGMGPAAGVDMMRKIIALTPAERDQDHLPLVMYSDPRVPDRVGPVFGRGESPAPAMIRGIRALEAAGAEVIAIACNTAYHWYDELAAAARVPILHIVDAVLDELKARGLGPAPVGLLATTATLKAGFYQRRLEAAGYGCLLPEEKEMEEFVIPGIRLVKQARERAAAPLFTAAVERLQARGAAVVILACTEIPIALEAADSRGAGRRLDATEALAKACIRRAGAAEPAAVAQSR